MLNNDKRGPGFWKFNCSLLRDFEYVNMVKKMIRNTIAIEIDQNPGLIWETIKLNVHTETTRYSSRKKKKNNNIRSTGEEIITYPN